jgi:ribosomal protein RSM22 (predicted rRNA methylase)
VRLPPKLQQQLDLDSSSVDRAKLRRAVEQVSAAYKLGEFQGTLNTPEARAAYLVTRLPATYAANVAVFRELRSRTSGLEIGSLLDLGSGPGTAAWAAATVWPGLVSVIQVESNLEMASVGRRLAEGSGNEALSQARWVQSDLQSAELPKADLVVLSYALGELRDADGVANKAWNATTKLLAIIEPGTPRNFSTLANVRKQLIASGAKIVAPCPHELSCPLFEAGDWCHFSVRLERSADHRRLKGGTLGYEDEKFSYVVFSREPVQKAETRVVRHPLIHSGHIELQLCTADGIVRTTVTRSQKPAFRAARKTNWGDEWKDATEPQFE